MGTNQGANKSGQFIAVSESPDVCKTPPNDAPIPYTIVAKLDGCLSVSPDVFYNGEPVVLVDESRVPNVEGDASGSSGGLSSGCNQGEVQFIGGDASVLVNGKQVVRHGDPVSMNKGNTTGRVMCLAEPEPACGTDANGKSKRNSDPPVVDPRKAREE